MTGSPSNDNPSPDQVRGVRFADAAAEVLLRDHLGELCDPPSDRWEQVKHNPSRTVYRGRIDGRQMYLKHFHDRSFTGRLLRRLGASGALRELELSRRLAAAGVAASPVLAAVCNASAEWVLTEAVAPGPALEEWHVAQAARGADGARAAARMSRALAKLLAATHAAGVVHRDLHCGNVMIGPGGRPVLMDLHRASHKRYVSRRLRVMNLAQLCHDRTPMTTRTQRLRFLKQYLHFSGAGGSVRGWELQITQAARRHTRRQQAHLDRRIFRRNTYSSPVALPGRWRGHVMLASKQPYRWSRAADLVVTPEQWADALGDVEGLLTGPDVTVVKDTPSGLVVRRELALADRTVSVFIKRPRRRGVKKLLDLLRRSRPRRAFGLGHMMLNRRFATAVPLAVLERRRGPVVTDSLLITEAVDGPMAWRYLTDALAPRGSGESLSLVELSADAAAVEQAAAAASGESDRAFRRRACQAHRVLWSLGRLVRRLHEAGFRHRDLKTVNLLMHCEPGRLPEALFIDLDGVSRPPVLTVRRRLRDLGRLMRALRTASPRASAACRLRVLRGYMAPPGGPWVNWKILWHVIAEFGAGEAVWFPPERDSSQAERKGGEA